MNIYMSTEPEKKLKSIFSNIKSFFILDILSFINSLGLDLTKQSNIFFINTEIINTIKLTSKLKKYQGIIYINKNLNELLIHTLRKTLKKDVNKFILIDNGLLHKHEHLYSSCEEIIFYERFLKNKIIECNGITYNKDEQSMLFLNSKK